MSLEDKEFNLGALCQFLCQKRERREGELIRPRLDDSLRQLKLSPPSCFILKSYNGKHVYDTRARRTTEIKCNNGHVLRFLIGSFGSFCAEK